MSSPNDPEAKKTDTPPSAVEFEPPVACVRRILKHALPSSTNVGKDALAAFARSSGIFIIYLTTCANDFARENKRQTITANDVLAAVKELDFDEFTPEMMTFLESYRLNEKSKKDAKAAANASKLSQAETASPNKEDESKGESKDEAKVESKEESKEDESKEEESKDISDLDESMQKGRRDAGEGENSTDEPNAKRAKIEHEASPVQEAKTHEDEEKDSETAENALKE